MLTNQHKPWLPADDRLLKALAKGNTPTRVMGIKFGRSPEAIQAHAQVLGITLKPVNQRPYGTAKKK